MRAVSRAIGRDLAMKLVTVDYTYDGRKAIFYFTAENRVDFRDLVRDLANTLRVRVEMKQIGARDESKVTGGLGPCETSISTCGLVTFDVPGAGSCCSTKSFCPPGK